MEKIKFDIEVKNSDKKECCDLIDPRNKIAPIFRKTGVLIFIIVIIIIVILSILSYNKII